MQGAPPVSRGAGEGAGGGEVTHENPYFTAYRRAHGLTKGGPWIGYQFTEWVQAQWREFEALHGLTGKERHYHRDQFSAWMAERWLT